MTRYAKAWVDGMVSVVALLLLIAASPVSNPTDLGSIAQDVCVSDAAGGCIQNEAASVTNPTLIPNKTDPDTGVGGDGSDSLSLITGGVEALRIDSSQRVIIGGISTLDDFHVEESTAGEAASIQIRHSDNTNTASRATLSLVTVDGTSGDQSIVFAIANVGDWSIGVDNSDEDKFKISTTSVLEGATRLTIDRNGEVTFANNVFVSNDTNNAGVVIGHTAKLSIGGTAQFQILGTTSSNTAQVIGRWSNNATAPKLSFFKSRAANIGSSVIVEDNDIIGMFRFCPDDGTVPILAAQYSVEVDDASPAVGDIGVAFVWEQMDGGGGALAETMRLSAAGNLEIGLEGGGTKRLAIKGSDPTGTDEGAEIQLFLADDFDTTITNYVIDVFQDDLRFFGAGGSPNMTLTAEGYLVLTSSAKTTTGDPASREGMIYWNTFDNAIRMFADGAWRTLASW